MDKLSESMSTISVNSNEERTLKPLKDTQPLEAVRRTEKSLIYSNEDRKSFSSGTALHSVFYHLPHHEKELWYPFIKTLRKVFPRNKGLGLIITEVDSGQLHELALPTEEDCISALSKPIYFRHAGETYILPATTAIPPTHQLYKVELSKITLLRYDVLKSELMKTFSKFGTVLDIVIYEDDITGSWFTGNGHVYISCKKSNLQFCPQSVYVGTSGGYYSATVATWIKK